MNWKQRKRKAAQRHFHKKNRQHHNPKTTTGMSDKLKQNIRDTGWEKFYNLLFGTSK